MEEKGKQMVNNNFKKYESYSVFEKKKVLITGHTGFKGSWLSLWLSKLGAEIYGLSDEVKNNPLYDDLNDKNIFKEELLADINDFQVCHDYILRLKPDFIFHLAAQPIVIESYHNPYKTFKTNILGTLNLVEISRKLKNIVFINVTSDKCYLNKEQIFGYNENDSLGGHDPYSASKAASEIVSLSYINSFTSSNFRLANVRSGNVIGGSDFSDYRIISDVIKTIENKQQLIIRSPDSIRPWQHVLEPLSGYMLLASLLFSSKDFKKYMGAWNFGPLPSSSRTVKDLVNELSIHFTDFGYTCDSSEKLHETSILKLNIDKSTSLLNWYPVYDFQETIKVTAEWFIEYRKKSSIISFTENQILDYCGSN